MGTNLDGRFRKIVRKGNKLSANSMKEDNEKMLSNHGPHVLREMLIMGADPISATTGARGRIHTAEVRS